MGLGPRTNSGSLGRSKRRQRPVELPCNRANAAILKVLSKYAPEYHRIAMTHAVTMPALKEWSAVVHALLDGRQRVLLRKGGIGEKRFDVTAREFLLFPTVAHSHAERVRPEFRDLLTAAAADSADDRLVVRAVAKVVAVLAVNRTDNIAAIEDLHIWTAESVRRDRLDFRPKHRLAVLVVQAIPLDEPVELPRTPDYAGCTSWVQLPLRGPSPSLGVPVHDEASLCDVAARVRDAVE